MDKYITAYYLDEEDLLKGIGQMKAKGLKILDVLTPFPVHGIDKALNMRRSRLTRVAFVAGAIGAVLGFGFQAWIFTVDYPLNIGGKPFFAVPSFMPVAFELTVLFSAFAMVIAFFVSNKLGPGAKALIHDERATDDRFLVVVEVDDSLADENIKEIELALAEAGAEGITLKA
ncbi:DUF3341 domain-containing protein [Sunxiuqinia dokdonensis]|uniref:Quinol:cytochrome C oxidoreductase n=1 Tax=Sunxiuqinia dokdonensis TaxID=1409788 RepID=A0A0L8V7Q9_9BACT|nr:DUF3341 domain-containing protein [Sunxiuqinia dokdonensis]KOH44217.1 hypothetical protein NC99_29700 [Sunxiuqinia dokdonensis]